MPRILPIIPAEADEETAATYEAVRPAFGGKLPNLIQTFARSPAAINGFLALSGALGKGRLTRKQREIVALAAAQFNECHYCLSAHSAAGKMVGLSAEQIIEARQGRASEALDHALAVLARKIVETRGQISDADLAMARGAGVDDGLVVETIANVVVNIFTNYTNNVAQTEVDFPKVEIAIAATA